MSTECKLADPSSEDIDVSSILSNAKTIAVVGISPKAENASHRVAKYLIEHGFKVIGVNPNCDEVLGIKCYPDLKSVPEHVDLVDVFRKLDAIPGIVDEAIEIGADAIWLQLGLKNEESAEKARCAGLKVVMDKCTKTEHSLRAIMN